MRIGGKRKVPNWTKKKKMKRVTEAEEHAKR